MSGIVPLEGREPLRPEQHDQVMTDVQASLIKPLTRELGVRMLDYRVHVGPVLEDVLSPEGIRKRHAFSAVANKGNLHPLDIRRWAEFIAQTHTDDAVVSRDLLASWLEDDGFGPAQRDRLLADYESGRRTLSAYDEERR